MAHWEYKTAVARFVTDKSDCLWEGTGPNGGTVHGLDALINAYAAEGWALVAVTPTAFAAEPVRVSAPSVQNARRLRFFFKRRPGDAGETALTLAA